MHLLKQGAKPPVKSIKTISNSEPHFYCPECGCPKYYRSKRCRRCSYLAQRLPDIPDVVIVEGGIRCRQIALTKGKVALVNEHRYEELNRCRWHVGFNYGRWYAWRSERLDGKAVTVYMHRVIHQTPEGLHTDHRDGDGLNNWEENLRTATRSQNNSNSKKAAGKTSQFKGVTWIKAEQVWLAQIVSNRKNHKLGRFSVEEDAARAYDMAAIKYHGEFARLNFSLSDYN